MFKGIGARVAIVAAAQALVGAAVFLTAKAPEPAMQLIPAAQRGENAWRANGCGSCHAVLGLGGHMGPDLTNVISRRGPEYVQAAIINGVGRMPARKLAPSEANAIVAYLQGLDGLALYPLPSLAAADSFGRFPAKTQAQATP